MQATTALRKISALKKKIWGIQGGQGAGKTYSILLLLINHAIVNKNREIYIASSELSKMRITVIKDFVNIINNLKVKCEITGTKNGSPLAIFPSGSFIQFIGLDKEDIGKGLRSDIMFINEANKTNFDTYRELTSRAKRIIIDFNPNKKFWFHTEILTRDDCDFLKLTFQDNEFLSHEERYEILRYKEKGFDTLGNVVNQYWANMWRVYGLGEVGQVEGRIYTWQPISLQNYLKIEKQAYYGVDWGKVDPFAIVEIKYHDGNLYLHEKHYESENDIERKLPSETLKQIKSNDTEQYHGLVPWLFTKLQIPKSAIACCDNNYKFKILSLRNSGWEYVVGVGRKLSLAERVSLLSGLNVYYTDCSKNIEYEQENYCYAKDKNGNTLEVPVDQDNHTLDASTYGVQKMFELGVIKHI
jgi:phage terminase large subunit